MNQEIFKKYRILFYTDGCDRCRIYMGFIERYNKKLPIEKRIRLIDCTYYKNYGIINDPLILLFNRHITGYPTIFFDGMKIDGTNSRIESEAILHTLLHNEFVVREINKYEFNKDCEIKKGIIFKERVICN